MTMDSFTIAITVDETPEQAFAAINNVRGWWSQDIEGRTDTVGEAFDYRYQDVHRCRIQVTDLVPGRKVAWHVLDNYFSFTKDPAEWKDTRMVFDISRQGGKTNIRFTHVGLYPDHECYEACNQGWGTYIGSSLRDLIAKGKGQPNAGQPMTEKERALTA